MFNVAFDEPPSSKPPAPTHGNRKKWSDSELKELQLYCRQNLSYTEIGKRMHICPHTARKKIAEMGISKDYAFKASKHDDKVKEFIKQNFHLYSARQIGNKLGLTRNAVLGLAHRMGLSAPAKRKGMSLSLSDGDIPPLELCEYPFGDPGNKDFHYCEKPVERGKPYCPEHCAVSYEDRTTAKKIFEEESR